MNSLHLDWLKESGESPEFLGQCLENGFVLHPLEPDTVALIYRKDIGKLDHYEPVLGDSRPIVGCSLRFVENKVNKSKGCYELLSSGSRPSEVASLLGVLPSNVRRLAGKYADAHGLAKIPAIREKRCLTPKGSAGSEDSIAA
jgi:hypothetical protein